MKVSNYEIIELVAQTLRCDVNSITEGTGIGHHPKWDSLGHMLIMTALEDKYKVVVGEDNIVNLLSITGIVEYLNTSLGTR